MNQRKWALGALALLATMTTGNAGASVISSISTNFNGGAIAAGNDIWFSAVMKPGSGFDKSVTTNVFVTNQTISFTANSVNYVLIVPDAEVTFQPGLGTATTSFSGGDWNTITGFGSGNTFLSGLAFQAPVALPGGIHNVTWQATFSGPAANKINWQWSAATYDSSFFTGDYNALGVKASDDNHLTVGSDHAGTPESKLADFLGGAATGGSGSNYTGSLSGTASFALTPGDPVPAPVPLPLGVWGGIATAGVLITFKRQSARQAA